MMSRWIEADALKKSLEAWAVNLGNSKMLVKEETEIVIDSAPSIDICFCNECKHRKPSGYVGSVKTYECGITGFRMHDLTNHFCSYGERSE